MCLCFSLWLSIKKSFNYLNDKFSFWMIDDDQLCDYVWIRVVEGKRTQLKLY